MKIGWEWEGRELDTRRKKRGGEGETDHVWGRKVAHDELVLAFLENLGDLLGDTVHAHLRLLVVGRDLG